MEVSKDDSGMEAITGPYSRRTAMFDKGPRPPMSRHNSQSRSLNQYSEKPAKVSILTKRARSAENISTEFWTMSYEERSEVGYN